MPQISVAFTKAADFFVCRLCHRLKLLLQKRLKTFSLPLMPQIEVAFTKATENF
jgi:hypothetical protein